MAVDRGTNQSSLDSKQRAVDVVEVSATGVRQVCATDDDGSVVLIDDARLSIYDKRGRRIATITDLAALFDAFDGLEI